MLPKRPEIFGNPSTIIRYLASMIERGKMTLGMGREVSVSVPVLCKFWMEDGIWNGIAEDLSVAVSGETFEAAMSNLRQAIESHMESAIELGEFKRVIALLETRAREYGFLSLDEISPNSALVKMLVAVKNRELVAVT